MKRPTPREIAFIIAALPGVAVPFLPFTTAKDGVPVLVLIAFRASWSALLVLFFAFLAVPVLILASTTRQALFGPLTRGEAWLAYGVSFAALAAVALHVLTRANIHPSLVASTWIVALGTIAVLASTIRSRVPRSVHAHVALLVAYVPSVGFFCLLGFGSHFEIDKGFYLAIVAFVAYVVEATLRVRQARGMGAE